MGAPRRKYASFSDVQVGDEVYIAWFEADGENGRRAVAPKLVVHGTDFQGGVAVRDARTPGEPWYAGGHEWTPSWTALFASAEDAIAHLNLAASRGWE